MKKILKPGSVACFRRWSRKSYSAFASVGRCVTIGVLWVGMSMLSLVANGAYASEAVDTLSISQNIELRDVGVTHTKDNPTRSAMLQKPIFSRATEAAAPIQTLESALRLSPSVDVRERGGKGVQADLSIRGGSFDQTMVMLNGINFTDARTGHQTHSLPVDIESVAGIELIDGVAGVGAYAGAINIRTSPLRDNYLRAAITSGDYGYIYNSLSGAVTRDKLNLFGAVSYRKSDGYTHNTAFENINAFVRATYDSPKSGFWDIQAGYQDREFGANGFYSLKFLDQYEATKTALASLRWLKDFGSVRLNSSVSYRKNFDRFELIHDAPETVPYNYHNTDNLGAEIWAEYTSKWGMTTLGGDYTFNHIWSTNLGEQTEEANGRYTHEADRNILNFYLRHTKDWSKVGVSAYAGVSSTPYGTQPIWSISGNYRPVEGLRMEIGANESMRLPTFTDLYYTSATNIPNASLQPELATTYIFNTSYQRSAWRTVAQIYYRDGRNIIDWTQGADDPEGVWTSRQFTQLGTFGVELSASYTFDSFVRRLSASYGYVTQNKDSGEYLSKYAFEYMHNKGVLSADFAITKNLSLILTGSLYDREGTYSDSDGVTQNYEPYFLLDGRISWQRGGIMIYADATNITSTLYYDYGGLAMPQIWASGGISVTF